MHADSARPPVMKVSLAIASEFRERIARGELRNGDPLPVESQLVEELGVSKGTVREALRILEMQGLVEMRRGVGGGPRVRHPDLSEAAIPMGVYLQIGDVEVMDVWEARDRIIGGAIERLAGQRGEPDPEALETSVAALRETVGDLDAYYALLIDVSETFVRFAGNATDHVLVRALRFIIATELERATRAVVDIDEAIAIEVEIANAWTETTRHIRAGRAAAARRAYERQAALVRSGVAELSGGTTFVDVFRT